MFQIKATSTNVFILVLWSITMVFSQEKSKQFASAFSEGIVEQKVIVFFTGSEWSIPSRFVEKTIINTRLFKDYIKDKYLLMYVYCSKREKMNKEKVVFYKKYNPKGYFPFVVVLNKEGEVLGEIGYKNVSVEEYIQLIEKF